MTKKISNKKLKQLIEEAINEQTSLNERRWTIKDKSGLGQPPKPIAWKRVKADLVSALKARDLKYTKGWWKQIPNSNDPLRRKFRDYWKAVKYHRKSAQDARADKMTPPKEKGFKAVERAHAAIMAAIEQLVAEVQKLQELPAAEGMNLGQLARSIKKLYVPAQGDVSKQLQALYKKIEGRDPGDPHTGDAPPKTGATHKEKTGHSTNWEAVKQATGDFGKFGSKGMFARIAKGTGDFDTDHQAIHGVHDRLHKAAPWMTDKTTEADALDPQERTLIRLHNLLLKRIDWFHGPLGRQEKRAQRARKGQGRGAKKVKPVGK